MRSGLCRTTLTTHVDVEAYTVFGAPMQLSTAIIPSGQCSNASLSGPGSECAHGRWDGFTGCACERGWFGFACKRMSDDDPLEP